MIPRLRSMTSELIEGTTDGKYRKSRPDTTVAPGMGDHLVRANRESLLADKSYGYPTTEYHAKVSPGKV